VTAYDLFAMDRVGVPQIGMGLEDVTTFGKYLGGSPTNVAVAAARFGVTTRRPRTPEMATLSFPTAD